MKTHFICLSLMLMLSLSACNSNTNISSESTPENLIETQAESTPETTSESSVEALAETDTKIDSKDNSENNSASVPDVTSDTPSNAVPKVSFETIDLSSEGDKTSFTFSYQKAAVEIPGNNSAAAKIQAVLDNYSQSSLDEINAIVNDTNYMLENNDAYESDFDIMARYVQSFTVTRCDSKMLSFRICLDISYPGSAHGGVVYYGAAFDSTTGEELTLEVLGDEVQAISTEKALKLAAAFDQKNPVFYPGYEADIPEYLIANDNFYFTEDGITFIDNQYMLQPYAGGYFFFNIGYEDVTESLYEQYLLPSGKSYVLTPDGSRFFLDGTFTEPDASKSILD